MVAAHLELAAEFGITLAHFTGQAQHNKVSPTKSGSDIGNHIQMYFVLFSQVYFFLIRMQCTDT